MTDDSTKIAYAAGLLDGEGSILTALRIKRWTPQLIVAIQMCDERVLVWMAENFGGGVYVVRRKQPPTLPNGAKPVVWRQQYQWKLLCGKAGEFLKLVQPYLIVKRQQCERALALRALTGKRSQRITPERHVAVLELARQISSLNRTGTAGS